MLRIIFPVLVFAFIVRIFVFPIDSPTSKDKTLNLPIISQIKANSSKAYDRVLGKDYSGLLTGIVFGTRADFDKEFFSKLQEAGVLHVIAASGMNVSMVAGFLVATLVLFMRRQQALLVAGIGVFLYASLADFQVSIVRASIMAYFAFAAGIVGRQNSSLWALFLTAYIMLLVNPTLVSSLSFQLSFSATLGIILFDPLLKRGILKKGFFEDARTTVSAQITTTPILLFAFSTYSLVSVPVNFLILWTVPPLMILGALASFLANIWAPLSIPVLFLCLPFLMYFKAVVLFFSSYTNPVELSFVPWTIIVGYYLILLSLVLYLYKKQNLPLIR